MRYRQLALVCASLVLLMSGCIFSPKKGDGGGTIRPPAVYEIPQSPDAVLRNLEQAYEHRDSTAYKALFYKDYTGSSLDQKDPSPQLFTYTKDDEAAHIRGLAKSTSITVDLVLKPLVNRYTDAGDPPGWTVVQNPIQNLTIYDGNDTYVITGADETIEFRFIPKTPDASSPTDTTWEIVKWTEIRL